MQTRELGRSGLQVSALGLGCIHHGARGPRGLCTQLLTLEIHEVVRLPIYLGEGAHLIHQATQRLGR